MCGIAAPASHIGALRLTRRLASHAAVRELADGAVVLVDGARDRVVHEDGEATERGRSPRRTSSRALGLVAEVGEHGVRRGRRRRVIDATTASAATGVASGDDDRARPRRRSGVAIAVPMPDGGPGDERQLSRESHGAHPTGGSVVSVGDATGVRPVSDRRDREDQRAHEDDRAARREAPDAGGAEAEDHRHDADDARDRERVGLRTRPARRAAATGSTMSAATSSTPTMRVAATIVTAVSAASSAFSALTGRPITRADSSSSPIANHARWASEHGQHDHHADRADEHEVGRR